MGRFTISHATPVLVLLLPSASEIPDRSIAIHRSIDISIAINKSIALLAALCEYACTCVIEYIPVAYLGLCKGGGGQVEMPKASMARRQRRRGGVPFGPSQQRGRGHPLMV